MSFTTKPAFIKSGSWDSETRAHPAMKWMEHYTIDIVDAQRWDTPWEEIFTESHNLVKSDGTVIEGGANSWEALRALYAPFTEHLHQPSFLVCSETPSGWQMFGKATVFVNLPGEPAPGEMKVTDANGKSWDVSSPGAFQFQYEKVGDGIKLSRAEIMSDTAPAMTAMLKRGLITPKDLGL